MTTLAGATLALSRVLGNTLEGVSTGGNATTLVDAAQSQPADFFTGGTIWFLSGANAGKSAVITAWDPVTHTFTFAAPGGVCAAGNLYAAAPLDFPRYLLVQALNQALVSLGPALTFNTALVVVADQESYILPAGVEHVVSVEIAQESTAPYLYQPHYHWTEDAGALRFDTDLAPGLGVVGYKLRLGYIPYSITALALDADLVSPALHPDLLSWLAAVHALRWRVSRQGGDEPWWNTRLNEALLRAEQERSAHPVISQRERDPHLGRW